MVENSPFVLPLGFSLGIGVLIPAEPLWQRVLSSRRDMSPGGCLGGERCL